MTAAKLELTNLAPGDFVYGTGGRQLYFTVLGSCVSLVLWHPASRFYAMCHYISPHTPATEAGKVRVQGKYADQVLPYLWQQVQKHQIPPQELQVSLAGGAGNLLSGQLARQFQIGALNLEMARHFIAEHQLNLYKDDTGGQPARRLRFDSRTGALEIEQVVAG
ncbi:chemotaxis protein CheD [Rheinheimera sp.]|uniref:chemotaxis protein CheD n=1 Tax=Rheinheimera sp. TaxID=1869214 RepID=UPI00307D415E